jgi:hypothetical protein
MHLRNLAIEHVNKRIQGSVLNSFKVYREEKEEISRLAERN